MVPVCDKRYHIYNRFRHFWAEIKKLWNYPLVSMALSMPSVKGACVQKDPFKGMCSVSLHFLQILKPPCPY